jgi:hypothetical protein
VQKVQKVQKRQLRNRCTFYYNHLDLNDNKKSKDKDDKEEKDNYKKLLKSHLEKKGKKKYWSNISRKGNTNNDLI